MIRINVRVWCAELDLADDIGRDVRLFGARPVFIKHWRDFVVDMEGFDCSVFVLHKFMDSRMVEFLKGLEPGRAETELSSWPLILIAEDTFIARDTRLAAIPHVKLSRSKIGSHLADSLSQETARACLRHAELSVLRLNLSSLMRAALLIALNEGEPISNVSALAHRMDTSSSTLHHHWKSEGLSEIIGSSFKNFFELILLLKFRSRFAIGADAQQAARSCGTTAEHVQKSYRGRIGPWRERNRGGWIELARVVRTLNWRQSSVTRD